MAKTIKELHAEYILSDGKISSVVLDFLKQSVTISLAIRRVESSKRVSDYTLQLLFSNVVRFDVLEDFGTSGQYSDITLIKTTEGNFYVALDPYGNSGQKHIEDNFVIEAPSFSVADKDGIWIDVS